MAENTKTTTRKGELGEGVYGQIWQPLAEVPSLSSESVVTFAGRKAQVP
jgi:hypothetical protein